MAKLVTVESGLLAPLRAFNYYGGTVITEKTQLIIDGDDITLIFEDGLALPCKGHQLLVNDRSNYKEKPLTRKDLFFINLRHRLVNFWYFVNRHIKDLIFFFRRNFQAIFSKYHISNYDLGDLDSYLAERILPKIKAYRENYLKREVREIPPVLSPEDIVFHDVPVVCSNGEMSGEEQAWVAVMDEIIFAMRWLLEASSRGSNSPGKIAFFQEFYGQYILWENDKEKHYEQAAEAKKRAQKGFEAFGRFFTCFWY